jgi:hypothetical protein
LPLSQCHVVDVGPATGGSGRGPVCLGWRVNRDAEAEADVRVLKDVNQADVSAAARWSTQRPVVCCARHLTLHAHRPHLRHAAAMPPQRKEVPRSSLPISIYFLRASIWLQTLKLEELCCAVSPPNTRGQHPIPSAWFVTFFASSLHQPPHQGNPEVQGSTTDVPVLVQNEGEWRKRQMLDIAISLDARYRTLLPRGHRALTRSRFGSTNTAPTPAPPAPAPAPASPIPASLLSHTPNHIPNTTVHHSPGPTPGLARTTSPTGPRPQRHQEKP